MLLCKKKSAALKKCGALRTACGIRTRDPQTENLMSWTTRRKQHRVRKLLQSYKIFLKGRRFSFKYFINICVSMKYIADTFA